MITPTTPNKAKPNNEKKFRDTVSTQVQTDFPPIIRRASQARLCPELFRFPSCLLAAKYEFDCPYSHSLEELRGE